MTKAKKHPDQNESLARRHEVSDANFRNLIITGLGLLGLMVLGLLLSGGIYVLFIGETSAPGTPTETFTALDTTRIPPGPNLQPDPHGVLVALRVHEDSLLTSYAWVNKDSGIVRIPIERAMKLLVQKGLPQRERGSQ